MVIAHVPPEDEISALCEKAYGLRGEFERLPGENLNYLLTPGSDSRYVLKLAGGELPADVIELEYTMIEHLISAGVNLRLPRILLNNQGQIETRFSRSDKSVLRARLLSFVEGKPWGQAGKPGKGLLRNLGETLAIIDRALADLDHPAAHRKHRWDLTASNLHREKLALFKDIERLKKIVNRSRNLHRSLNNMRGMRRVDEKPPADHWKRRFPELEETLLSTYYKFKGWNNQGI